MATLVNPFEQPGRWYKAALHLHTTTSDGAKTPREMTQWYRRLGYQIVVLTDHFKTNDITGLGRKNFLVISGISGGRRRCGRTKGLVQPPGRHPR